ncbi:MAG: hypothetical protein ABI858_03885 [Pseudoxanthomonas sp.]
MTDPNSSIAVLLGTSESHQTATRLNAFKQEIIQERWLSTLILSIHLELEACLEVLLGSIPVLDGSAATQRNVSFSKKLKLRDNQRLLDQEEVGALYAVNLLRNELAHRLDNQPRPASIFRFIASMSAIHPLTVSDGDGYDKKELRTFQEVERHFTGEEEVNLSDFVFFSLMLLRSKMLVRVKPSMNQIENARKAG